ncbi:MAG: LysR family transcriptional regulator [Actinomycetota bacterium]
MDLRQLDTLVAVAEHRTFSAAATALHTVQSNVSSHIAKLERELAVELVDRGAGRLTRAGEVVVQRARRVHAELAALTNDLASVQGEVSGRTLLGMVGTTSRWLTAPLVEGLLEQHPGVELVLVEATTTGLLPQVIAGRIEQSIVNLPIADPDFDVEILFDEELVCVTPTNHPLAELDSVDLVELARHPLLLGPPGNAVRDVLDRVASDVDVQLDPLVQIDGVRLMASLAIDGFGPTVVPVTAMVGTSDGDWRSVPIEEAPRRRVGLVRHSRALPSAPGRAVTRVLRETVIEQAALVDGIHAAETRGDPPGTSGAEQ